MAEERLKRSVNFVEAVSIVIGGVIGSGIFLKPGIVFQHAGSVGMGVLAWVIGGIITLASALTIAEIAAAIPRTGGLYAYLEDLYGDIWGFLLGWVQTVISYPASGAALAIAFSTFATFFVPLTALQQKILAVAILLFVIIMNIFATKLGGMIQTVATVGKLIPIVILIAAGLMRGEVQQGGFAPLTTAGAGFGAALLGTLWAYDGWISVSNMAEELKNPIRDLPRSIVLGVASVIGVYALFNYAVAKTLPLLQIIAAERPASEVAVALFGTGGAAFITAGILISVFGAMNSYLMTGARVPFAMAERNQLPYSHVLGKTHQTFQTPANALMAEALLAILYIISGTFNTLTDLIVFVLWIFFVMGVYGVFLLRKKVGPEKRPHQTPLYPITPMIGLLGGVYILYSTVVGAPGNTVIGILITGLGLPIYYYRKGKGRAEKGDSEG